MDALPSATRQRSPGYGIKPPAPQASSGHTTAVELRAHAGGFLSGVSLVSACIAVVFAIAAILAHHFWPFTEAAVRSDLASATSSEVRFGHFHERYFPPGCVAEDVTLREPSSGNQVVSIRRLTIKSFWGGLLRHRVSLITADGLHGQVAPRTLFSNASGNAFVIDKLVADGAILDIPEHGQQKNLQFRIHKVSLSNLNKSEVISFSAVLDLPFPSGRATISGKFGPWRTSDPTTTSISGKYSLENADLSVFKSIAGNVSSSGTFDGDLEQIHVAGSTHSPEFIVARTQHGLPLETSFEAIVETHTGNVTLPHFTAKFGRDQIFGSGSIARRGNGRRSAELDLNCTRGRIEDTFYPFIKSARSPLTGDVSFRMQVELASGHEPFLQKLRLDSNFRIQHASFTNSQTQTRISKISAPPDQDKTGVPAELQGSVQLNDGLARFSSLDVHDEGAAATFAGNYNLEKETIDLHGKLKTAASLTKTTQGVKAIFAKVLEAFYKKRPHVTVVPVHIGGTYSHPNFGLDL